MDKSTKQLFSDIGIETKRNAGTDKVLCPKCSSTRKNKKDPCLSIDLETGAYHCHNDCGFNGYVKNQPEFVKKEKNYIKPIYQNNTSLSDNLVKYFFKRGISQKTLSNMKIGEGLFFMGSDQKENTVQFNYFRDGELINTKYRTGKKKFRMVKDAELIFYNVDAIKNSDWCIVVEGEIDCLSFIEAGVNEVVSVPNGASKGNCNLEYLDNCIKYFENKTKIIIATDNDEAGMSLRDELARRFGYERCFKVDYGSFKDANELITAKGTSSLLDVINPLNLIDFPLSGIITVNSIWDEVENYMQHGLQRGEVTGVLKDFDELVSFVPGQMMVLTGIPNHGKSPFALMIMCALSVKHGWKWGVFSPEHKPLAMFVIIICECLMGKRIRLGTNFTTREKEIARQFTNEHFYFIEPEDDNCSVDNIVEKAKSLVVRYGIKGMLIDPWNKLEHNIERGDNETTYISKQLDKIIRFDQRHGLFSIIIAHPTKIRKDKGGAFEIPNLYDISGSSNWFNKPDIGVTFYRNMTTQLSEIHVQKMKYNHLGKQGGCEVKYNVNNSRFNNLNGDWDNSNWIMPTEKQPLIDFTEPINSNNLMAMVAKKSYMDEQGNPLSDENIPF
jgi:twinkle protein